MREKSAERLSKRVRKDRLRSLGYPTFTSIPTNALPESLVRSLRYRAASGRSAFLNNVWDGDMLASIGASCIVLGIPSCLVTSSLEPYKMTQECRDILTAPGSIVAIRAYLEPSARGREFVRDVVISRSSLGLCTIFSFYGFHIFGLGRESVESYFGSAVAKIVDKFDKTQAKYAR